MHVLDSISTPPPPCSTHLLNLAEVEPTSHTVSSQCERGTAKKMPPSSPHHSSASPVLAFCHTEHVYAYVCAHMFLFSRPHIQWPLFYSLGSGRLLKKRPPPLQKSGWGFQKSPNQQRPGGHTQTSAGCIYGRYKSQSGLQC